MEAFGPLSARECLLDELFFAVVALVGERLDDLVLALEIAVDRSGAQIRLADDVFHARALEAAAREAFNCGIKNLASPIGSVRFAYLWQFPPPEIPTVPIAM